MRPATSASSHQAEAVDKEVIPSEALGLRGGLGLAGFVEEFYPDSHIMAVIPESSTAYEVAVDDAGFVDEGAAADLEIELGLGYGCHPATSHAIGSSRNLDTVTDAGDGSVFLKEIAGDTEKILVFTDVFGRPPATEVDAEVFLRIHVLEGDVSRHDVAFPLFCNGPTWLHLVHNHLVVSLLGSSKNGLITAFYKTEVRVQGVHRLGGIAENNQNLWF